ncbi:MAG: hypothetical protein RIE73_23150 [Coleofasciculus sp. C1-SOL-03]|uniref:hypothetical protein n=1 Tax=Coleofasciculus sp. C1-SOL-03 TaxID=3069522 RepID=UPI0033009EE2
MFIVDCSLLIVRWWLFGDSLVSQQLDSSLALGEEMSLYAHASDEKAAYSFDVL